MSLKTEIKISIIMAVNKKHEFLERAIESILLQTFEEFEFLIIVNGDYKRLLPILEKYKLRDERIKIYKTDIKQLQYNLNFGIDKAQSNIIARMDSDDISLPTRLEKQYNYLLKNNIDILGTNFYYIDKTNKIITKKNFIEFTNKEIRKKLCYHCVFCHPTLMYRKEVILDIGGYCFGKIAEDWDLFLRLSRDKNIVFGNLEEKLFKYRVHDSQMSSSNLKLNFFNISFLYFRELFYQKNIKMLKGGIIYLIFFILTPFYVRLKKYRERNL